MSKLFYFALALSLAFQYANATDMTFEAIDADADGQISAVEAALDPQVSENFSALDADENGAISMEEFAANMTDEDH